MADIQVDYMLPVKGWALVGGLGFVGNQAAWLDSCSQRAGPVWWVHLEEQEEAEQQASLGKTGREGILNILRNKKGSKTLFQTLPYGIFAPTSDFPKTAPSPSFPETLPSNFPKTIPT